MIKFILTIITVIIIIIIIIVILIIVIRIKTSMITITTTTNKFFLHIFKLTFHPTSLFNTTANGGTTS